MRNSELQSTQQFSRPQNGYQPPRNNYQRNYQNGSPSGDINNNSAMNGKKNFNSNPRGQNGFQANPTFERLIFRILFLKKWNDDAFNLTM